jgi:gamma-glutamylcyclotransferase (GGCT)/AIG2-like uncharacterized protein YtfP
MTPPIAAETATDLLFVYGTLKSAFDNGPARSLRQSATLVGSASIYGRMYAVCGPRGALHYPAVVPSENDGDLVHGEVYRLADLGVLDELDAYEGCADNSPRPHEYRRSITPVTLTGGAQLPAWVYWYALNTERLPPIPTGVFPGPIA